MGNEALRNFIAALVAIIWAVTAVASVVTQQYQPLEVVTPVMMLVTGFLFGFQITRTKANRRKEDQQ